MNTARLSASSETAGSSESSTSSRYAAKIAGYSAYMPDRVICASRASIDPLAPAMLASTAVSQLASAARLSMRA